MTTQNNGFNPSQQFPSAFANNQGQQGQGNQIPEPQQPQQPQSKGGQPQQQQQSQFPPFNPQPPVQPQGVQGNPQPAPNNGYSFGPGNQPTPTQNNGYGNGFGQPPVQPAQGGFGNNQPAPPMPNMATIFGGVGNASFGLPDKFYTRGGRYFLLVNEFFMKMSRDNLPTVILEGTVIKAVSDVNGVTPDQPNYTGFRVGDKTGVAKKDSHDPSKKTYFESHAAAVYLALTGTMPATGNEGAAQMAHALGIGENGTRTTSPYVGTIIEICGQNKPTKAGGVFMDISFSKVPITMDRYKTMITAQEASILSTDSLFCQKLRESGIDLNGVSNG